MSPTSRNPRELIRPSQVHYRADSISSDDPALVDLTNQSHRLCTGVATTTKFRSPPRKFPGRGTITTAMDDSLYDEFGNFIGTVESDVSDEEQNDLDARADAYLEDVDAQSTGEPVQEELMQVEGMVPWGRRGNGRGGSFECHYFA
jgi:hypothetical protein